MCFCSFVCVNGLIKFSLRLQCIYIYAFGDCVIGTKLGFSLDCWLVFFISFLFLFYSFFTRKKRVRNVFWSCLLWCFSFDLIKFLNRLICLHAEHSLNFSLRCTFFYHSLVSSVFFRHTNEWYKLKWEKQQTINTLWFSVFTF